MTSAVLVWARVTRWCENESYGLAFDSEGRKWLVPPTQRLRVSEDTVVREQITWMQIMGRPTPRGWRVTRVLEIVDER